MRPENRTSRLQKSCRMRELVAFWRGVQMYDVGFVAPLTLIVTGSSQPTTAVGDHKLRKTRSITRVRAADRTQNTGLCTNNEYQINFHNTQLPCGSPVRRLKEGMSA